MGLTCGLWSLIGPGACCVLSYRHDVGGGRASQFISTYESICQDLNGQVLLRLGLITRAPLPQPIFFISTQSHSYTLLCLHIIAQRVSNNMDVFLKITITVLIISCLVYRSNSPYILKVICSVILSVRRIATSCPHLNGTSEVSIRSDEHLEER